MGKFEIMNGDVREKRRLEYDHSDYLVLRLQTPDFDGPRLSQCDKRSQGKVQDAV